MKEMMEHRIEYRDDCIIFREEVKTKEPWIFEKYNIYMGHNVIIGKNTKIYRNVTIKDDCLIEKKCTIGDFVLIRNQVNLKDYVRIGSHNAIEPFAVIGQGTVTQGHCMIGEQTEVGAFCFLGPHFNTMSDPQIAESLFNPKKEYKAEPVKISNDCRFGSCTKICPGVEVASGTVTGAMTLITKNTKKNTMYVGIPAKKFERKNK